MNDKDLISGERLFLLYAYPCVDIRVKRGLITLDQAAGLEILVNSGRDPDHRLFGECFPDAIRLFVEAAKINPLGYEPWSVELVRNFWRAHKGRAPRCAVMTGEVKVSNDFVVKIDHEGSIRPAFNRYRLPVKLGDTAFIHQHVLVEVEERGS